MSEMPDPQPSLPFGTTDDDINSLWAMDCPACQGRGWMHAVEAYEFRGTYKGRDKTGVVRSDEREPCPNCGGSGGVEIPF